MMNMAEDWFVYLGPGLQIKVFSTPVPTNWVELSTLVAVVLKVFCIYVILADDNVFHICCQMSDSSYFFVGW